MSTLTPEAKQLLSSTIRSLRELLLKDLQVEAEGRYQLAVPPGKAGLDEAHRARRERLDRRLDEQLRASGAAKKDEKATRERLFKDAVKQGAATFLNRIVALRHLEVLGLSKPAVLVGGWNSKGYREFREFAPALTSPDGGDETQGYATLLGFVFEELAVDLPGLFGDVGLSGLFPIRASTLREVVERLDAPELASAWTDDTTLGWVYQYWNDPERELLDAKINARGKIEPHEIASKTQMFTERYMVEWLLHNSLGLTWLCICKKRGWTADADQVLPTLDQRRAEWREKRDAGEVTLDALMPIHGELEEHWKYYVPQPIPDDAVETAPRSVRDLKLLDPACGSGHFLVIAFDLLAALYREEARHEGRAGSDREIAESILENNLFGIDIDPRATQIAAGGLLIKAKLLAPEVHPKRLNLVAPALQLGSLPDEDPSLVQLAAELQRDVGIPPELTRQIVKALAGVDHLGSLLKVDAAVEDAIRKAEVEFERTGGQGDLFGGYQPQQVKLSLAETKASVLDKLEQFLAKHSRSEDLGLRLGGEQLAAGVRFVRLAKEGTYDIVVGNPPYQATTKMAEAGYVATNYPSGKADLYAAFLERGLQLVRIGGISALLTMRGWMFLNQFRELREQVLRDHDLRSLGDFDRGGFDEVPNEVLAVAGPVLRRAKHPGIPSLAVQPTPLDDKSYDRQRTRRKRAAVLAQVGRHEFDPRGFEVIEGEPIVYWWTAGLLEEYAGSPKLGDTVKVRQGMATTDNARFLRLPWEVPFNQVLVSPHADSPVNADVGSPWVPYIKGAAGTAWLEGVADVVRWASNGLEVKTCNDHSYGSFSRNIKNEYHYFRPGVAFSMIGSEFRARAHKFRSIIGNKGSSAFAADVASVTCLMNTARARFILASLNPGMGFEVGDVNRLPMFSVTGSKAIFETVSDAFALHELGQEVAFGFRGPGRSSWRHAQEWAQKAIDRSDGDALPPYEPEFEPPELDAFISFAVGIALGRFGANGEGVLDRSLSSTALPHGVLFVSATPHPDSLTHPACKPLLDAWGEHGASIAGKHADLGDYLRRGFFNEVHRPMYENRPIYFPLSSAKKNFVAYASIHRFMPTWDDVERSGLTWDEGERRGHTWDSFGDTALHTLLAEHLIPERRHLEGELEDLRKARTETGKKGAAEKRFADVQKLLEELNDFIETVTQSAERGPPPPDDKTPAREVDARFAMDLDDGVMVNSAALWPLLEPQWKAPKKWWKELATAKGRKDYDWSHLAERYFPARVVKKCLQDPSLAVAHRRFWKLWPEKAYAWELRLQDEIGPDFKIDEPESDAARAKFLADEPIGAAELRATEEKRRERKAAKAEGDSDGPLFAGGGEDGSPDDAQEDEADE